MAMADRANPETARKVFEARKEHMAEGDPERLSGQRATATQLSEARVTVASEDQPGYDIDLPEPDVTWEEWKGTELPFVELGDSPVQIAKMRNDPEVSDAELNDYIYSVLADKCLANGADEEFWRKFNILPKNDGDEVIPGLIDFCVRLMGGDSLPDEATEAAEQFRDE